MLRYVLRNAKTSDKDGLFNLSQHLNSVNLPSKKEELGHVIERSRQSFTGQIQNPFEREYVFILEDRERGSIIGTSLVIAQHGTLDVPHIYFDVYPEERYSKKISRHIRHTVLRLGYNYEGPTEVGGLILNPDYRTSPAKLGKQLSFVRFMFIGMFRSMFRNTLLAELLPPFNADGKSLLWEVLGRKLTGLEYNEADFLSRSDKEFIKSLFPETPIYASLLAPEVQSVIGNVGPQTKPAQKLLESVGFYYASKVDPFDGGPHFEAPTDEVWPVQQTKKYVVVDEPTSTHVTDQRREGMVAIFHVPFSEQANFICVQTSFVLIPHRNAVVLTKAAMEALKVEPGQMVYVLPI